LHLKIIAVWAKNGEKKKQMVKRIWNDARNIRILWSVFVLMLRKGYNHFTTLICFVFIILYFCFIITNKVLKQNFHSTTNKWKRKKDNREKKHVMQIKEKISSRIRILRLCRTSSCISTSFCWGSYVASSLGFGVLCCTLFPRRGFHGHLLLLKRSWCAFVTERNQNAKTHQYIEGSFEISQNSSWLKLSRIL